MARIMAAEENPRSSGSQISEQNVPRQPAGNSSNQAFITRWLPWLFCGGEESFFNQNRPLPPSTSISHSKNLKFLLHQLRFVQLFPIRTWCILRRKTHFFLTRSLITCFRIHHLKCMCDIQSTSLYYWSLWPRNWSELYVYRWKPATTSQPPKPIALFNAHPGTQAVIWNQLAEAVPTPRAVGHFLVATLKLGLVQGILCSVAGNIFVGSFSSSSSYSKLPDFPGNRFLQIITPVSNGCYNQPLIAIIPATAPTKRQRQVMRVQITGHHPWSPQKDWSRLAGMTCQLHRAVAPKLPGGLGRKRLRRPWKRDEPWADWSNIKLKNYHGKERNWKEKPDTLARNCILWRNLQVTKKHLCKGWWDSPKMSFLKIS